METDTIEYYQYEAEIQGTKDEPLWTFCPYCQSFHRKDSDVEREHANAWHVMNSEG